MLLLSCVFVGCAWLYMVTVSLLAGSEPVVRPVFHFDMNTDDATRTSARTDEQHMARIFRLARSGVGADLHSGTTSAVAPRRGSTSPARQLVSGVKTGNRSR